MTDKSLDLGLVTGTSEEIVERTTSKYLTTLGFNTVWVHNPSDAGLPRRCVDIVLLFPTTCGAHAEGSALSIAKELACHLVKLPADKGKWGPLSTFRERLLHRSKPPTYLNAMGPVEESLLTVVREVNVDYKEYVDVAQEEVQSLLKEIDKLRTALDAKAPVEPAPVPKDVLHQQLLDIIKANAATLDEQDDRLAMQEEQLKLLQEEKKILAAENGDLAEQMAELRPMLVDVDEIRTKLDEHNEFIKGLKAFQGLHRQGAISRADYKEYVVKFFERLLA